MSGADELWRALDETAVYVPPSYPPPADERAETHRYLPAVPTFFGQRCVHPAHLPLPATSQHASTEAYERLDDTQRIRKPVSGVRPIESAANTGAADQPADPVPELFESARSAGSAVAVLLALLSGCINPNTGDGLFESSPVRMGADTWLLTCGNGARVSVSAVTETQAIVACRKAGGK